MLKRQVRAAVASVAAQLPGGLWLVRLRAPFDRAAFPSADSPAARLIARSELDSLVRRVIAADLAP
jgi:ribonuclease P protein component